VDLVLPISVKFAPQPVTEEQVQHLLKSIKVAKALGRCLLSLFPGAQYRITLLRDVDPWTHRHSL